LPEAEPDEGDSSDDSGRGEVLGDDCLDGETGSTGQ
jgi:hypothetical protein